MAEGIIQVRNVSHAYGKKQVLDDISMDIVKGRLTGITGQSGCGKTTLLKIIAGLIEPDSGEVLIDGVDIFTLPRIKLLELRKEIGFIFQDGALLSNLSVFENVALPLRYHYDLPQEEVINRVESLLELYRVSDHRDMMPGHLSLGERKRIGVIRTLIMKPRIIFSDEPIGTMDAIVRNRVLDTLIQLRDDPEITLLTFTHNIDMIKQHADYIGILHDKRLLAYGKREDIVHSRDPMLKRILSIIVDETEMLAESVLGIMTGDLDGEPEPAE
jgi:ABC-type transporter Mla maintaining outer membrane lipid asymmetry ATPase subunit MlaF